MSSCTIMRGVDAPSHWLLTTLISPLVGPRETGGAYTAFVAVAMGPGGPPPHRHAREDELFYVIDGEFEFVFGESRLRGGPGACVFLPKGIVHTYNNVGSGSGTLFGAVWPSGFEAFAAEAGEACTDRSCPPEVGPATFAKLGAASAKFGIEMLPQWKADKPGTLPKSEEHWVFGNHLSLKQTSETSDGRTCFADGTVMPGGEVPAHTHAREDELFYIMQGAIDFMLEGRKVNAEAGTFIRVPRGVVHGFRNATNTPARMLNIHTPGGFEKFFRGVGTPCVDVSEGPPKEPPDMDKVNKACEATGMKIVVQ